MREPPADRFTRALRRVGRTPLTPLYRGLSAKGWELRLIEAGWPRKPARRMAAFLTGEADVPRWSKLLEEATS